MMPAGTASSTAWQRPDSWRIALVFALAFVLFGAQVVGIALPVEDWPITSAPMFAHYRSRGMPKFHFVFMGHFADGTTRQIRGKDIAMQEVTMMRLFFGSYYGSVDPRFPHGHRGDDHPTRFRQRLERFFSSVATEVVRYRPHEPPIDAIELFVTKVQPRHDDERRLVGRYQVASGRFDHLWAGRGPR